MTDLTKLVMAARFLPDPPSYGAGSQALASWGVTVKCGVCGRPVVETRFGDYWALYCGSHKFGVGA